MWVRWSPRDTPVTARVTRQTKITLSFTCPLTCCFVILPHLPAVSFLCGFFFLFFYQPFLPKSRQLSIFFWTAKDDVVLTLRWGREISDKSVIGLMTPIHNPSDLKCEYRTKKEKKERKIRFWQFLFYNAFFPLTVWQYAVLMTEEFTCLSVLSLTLSLCLSVHLSGWLAGSVSLSLISNHGSVAWSDSKREALILPTWRRDVQTPAPLLQVNTRSLHLINTQKFPCIMWRKITA